MNLPSRFPPHIIIPRPIPTKCDIKDDLMILEDLIDVTRSPKDRTWRPPVQRLRPIPLRIRGYLIPLPRPNLDEILRPFHRIHSAAELIEVPTPGRLLVVNCTAAVVVARGVDVAVDQVVGDFAAEFEAVGERRWWVATRAVVCRGEGVVDLAAVLGVECHLVVVLVVHAFYDVDFAVVGPGFGAGAECPAEVEERGVRIEMQREVMRGGRLQCWPAAAAKWHVLDVEKEQTVIEGVFALQPYAFPPFFVL